MALHRWTLAFVLLPLAVAAAEPAALDGAAPGAPSALSEAMERAQRRAANPMRAILEAGKIRRKADADAPASPPSPTRSAPVAVAASTVTTDPGSRAATPAAPMPAPPAEAVLSAAALGPNAADAAPPLSAPGLAPSLGATALEAPAAPVPLAQPRSEPHLQSMVAPEVPQSVLDTLGSLRPIEVDLSLRADGSVAEVVTVSPIPFPLRRYVTQALLQWRFDPLPAPRQHRVQLVFNPG